MKEYKINLLTDNIDFKLYLSLLSSLPSDCELIKLLTLRSTPDSELKDPKLIQLKNRLSLNKDNNDRDALKEFAMLMKGEG